MTGDRRADRLAHLSDGGVLAGAGRQDLCLLERRPRAFEHDLGPRVRLVVVARGMGALLVGGAGREHQLVSLPASSGASRARCAKPSAPIRTPRTAAPRARAQVQARELPPLFDVVDQRPAGVQVPDDVDEPAVYLVGRAVGLDQTAHREMHRLPAIAVDERVGRLLHAVVLEPEARVESDQRVVVGQRRHDVALQPRRAAPVSAIDRW